MFKGKGYKKKLYHQHVLQAKRKKRENFRREDSWRFADVVKSKSKHNFRSGKLTWPIFEDDIELNSLKPSF